MTHKVKTKFRYFGESRYYSIYDEPSYSNLFPYHLISSLTFLIILKLQPFKFIAKIVQFIFITHKREHFTFS